VLPLSMYVCAEDIGFTSFYVLERDQTDILNTQIYRKKEVTPISSTYKYIERGQTDILNAQIHRKRYIGFTSFYVFLC
jgi:hypothetical protein